LKRIHQLRYLFLASLLYALWWNFLDAAPNLGSVVGYHYQVLNGIGHFLPTLVFLWLHPARWEFAVSAGIFSTIVMDSPLWGLYHQHIYHSLPWGYDWITWSTLYFNPFVDKVWWNLYGLPVSSAVMFWSLILRVLAITGLIMKEMRIK